MKKDKMKAVVGGQISLDITPVFPDELGAVPFNELLFPGKLIKIGNAEINAGGVVSNTGLAMKIMGADVSFMGMIGNDDFGRIMREYYASRGAGGLLVSESAATSYTLVLVPPGTDRIFLNFPGANDVFSADDLDYDTIEKARIFHFGYPPLMRRMFIDNGDELSGIFRRVDALGTATSLDMAFIDPPSEAGRADWHRILEKTLPHTDFFLPSAAETAFMLDKQKYFDLEKKADGRDITEILSIEDDVAPMADELIGMGAKIVLIKCGAMGVYCRTAGRQAIDSVAQKLERSMDGWADRTLFEKSYIPDRVLSGSGAGDCAIGAFLTSVLEGCGLEESLRLCTAAGAACVEEYGTTTGMRPLADLRARIDAGWRKNN